MTLLTGTPREQLALNVDARCFREVEAACVVEEARPDGRAHITCTLRAGDSAIQWEIGDRFAFPGLNAVRSADGVVLVTHAEGRRIAHVFECKRKIDARILARDVKPQLRGSLVRLLSLCAVGGITVDGVVFYVAYRKTSFLEDPSQAKLLIGIPDPSPVALANLQWHEQRRFELDGIDPGRIALRKVPLADDDAGTASIELTPPNEQLTSPTS